MIGLIKFIIFIIGAIALGYGVFATAADFFNGNSFWFAIWLLLGLAWLGGWGSRLNAKINCFQCTTRKNIGITGFNLQNKSN